MHRTTLLLLSALVGIALAVPSPRSTHVLHEKRAMEPVDWAKTSRLDADHILPMRFGLTQQNLDMVEEMLATVSHPESPRYGQHFTTAEIVDAFKPSDETIAAVTNWLVDAGLSRDRLRLSGNKGWIHVNVSTTEVENLLKAEYHVYEHPSGAKQIGDYFHKLPIHYSAILIFLFVKTTQDAIITLYLPICKGISTLSNLPFISTTEQEEILSGGESNHKLISSVAQ